MIHVALTYRRVVDDMNVFSSCVKYMSKYKETFWNVFNTRAATLPLGIWGNHSVERRYQHSWTLLDPFNTPHSDIGSSHRRRSAIKYTHRFWCVSNVAIHLDCDVLYLDVQSPRTDAAIFSSAYWRCSPTSRWSPYSTSTMINGILTYHRVVGDTNVFSSDTRYARQIGCATLFRTTRSKRVVR